MHPLSSSRVLPRAPWRLTARIGAAALALATLGCHDTITDPIRSVHSAEGGAASLLDSPAGGQVELTVTDQAPLAGDVKLVGHFPTATIVAMDVHQQFTLTAVPPFPPATAQLGLAGRMTAFGCSGQGSAFLLMYPDAGGYSFAFTGCQLDTAPLITSFSDTVALNGSVYYGYDYDAACPYPDQQCAAYSGSSGVSVTRIPASFAITTDGAHDGVLRATPRHEYVFRAAASPATIGRYTTPIVPVETRWTFTHDSGGAEAEPCEDGSLPVCTKTFGTSGVLTLVALVNGVQMTSAPLHVQVPELRLTLSVDSAAVGDTVLATTTVVGIDTTALSSYTVTPGPSFTWPSSPPPSGPPPCLGTKPVPLRCFIVLTQPGRAAVEVTALLDQQSGLSLASRRYVDVVEQSVAIDIVMAAGPNAGGSFTTRAPENRIALEARVSPANIEPAVTWKITDDPDDDVTTVPPSSNPPTGIASSFTVPKANESSARWPADHPGTLRRKALAYKVTASFVYRDRTYTSAPVVVRQDDYDAIRQEYIDFAKNRVLTRAELGSVGDPKRNSGDYRLWPSSPTLTERLPLLQELATRRFGHPLTITGGFRNPVHHHVHKSLATRESQHLYGAAVDFGVADAPAGMTPLQYFLSARGLTWEASVRGCFEPEEAIRAGNAPSHSLNHIHVDWRANCPSEWGGPA
jgi:uncharacterized protein YcbK (DUF882 family)